MKIWFCSEINRGFTLPLKGGRNGIRPEGCEALTMIGLKWQYKSNIYSFIIFNIYVANIGEIKDRFTALNLPRLSFTSEVKSTKNLWETNNFLQGILQLFWPFKYRGHTVFFKLRALAKAAEQDGYCTHFEREFSH